jgi:hypothetical protein
MGNEMDEIRLDFCGLAFVYLSINEGRGKFLTFSDASPSGKKYFYISCG